jgi:hypothetical protein
MRAGLLPALAGISATILLGSLASAQSPLPPSAPPPEQTAAPSFSPPPGQTAAPFTPEQLDQLTAPIALYPDPLMSQILMAATYPLEVVEAERWRLQPTNNALKGEQLAAALAQQRWDPSVKSLVAFPQILRMMDGNLTWTEQLGDAFLADQTAILDSVQRLRQRAEAAGKLQSTPQQSVSDEGAVIIIEPPGQNVVYVPVYDPNVVYGAWPYPDYPPDYFPGFFPGAAIGPPGFGWVGVGAAAPLFGWAICDWGHHRIRIDASRFNAHNAGQPAIASGVWQHDPSHRGGVPYRDVAVRTQFQGAAAAARAEALRGARSLPVAAPPAIAPPIVNAVHPAAEGTPTVMRLTPPAVQPSRGVRQVPAQVERATAGRMPAPRAVVVGPAPAGAVAVPRSVAVVAPRAVMATPRTVVAAPRAVAAVSRAAPAAEGRAEHR